jgi:hypothetical protein
MNYVLRLLLEITSYTTVYDPKVRTALECPAERLEIVIPKDAKRKIKRAIKENLTRGYRVKLRPYKVNIYNEGGFFKDMLTLQETA